MTTDAFVLGGVRTPFDRYASSVSHISRARNATATCLGKQPHVVAARVQLDEIASARSAWLGYER
jgi:hypothetical protein